jgi:hypothetical protein
MSNRFDPFSRMLGVFLAALVAPAVVTTVYLGLVFLNEPKLSVLVAIPVVALLAVPLGLIGALLFGSAGVLVAELFGVEPWLLPAIGAATGIAHTMFVLSYPGTVDTYAWVMGGMLAATGSDQPGGYQLLFVAAAAGGMIGGKVYRRIVLSI